MKNIIIILMLLISSCSIIKDTASNGDDDFITATSDGSGEYLTKAECVARGWTVAGSYGDNDYVRSGNVTKLPTVIFTLTYNAGNKQTTLTAPAFTGDAGITIAINYLSDSGGGVFNYTTLAFYATPFSGVIGGAWSRLLSATCTPTSDTRNNYRVIIQ
jgi:hypothetical protein